MPKPNPGESKKDYIGRFMRSGEAQSDFPDEKQRLAVAYSMYEKKNATPSYGKEFPWPKQYKCSFIEPGVVFYQDLGECTVCGNAMTCANNGSECQPEGATVLVKQDALAKMAQSFVGKPVIDMVHKDVTPSTVADGEADGIVTRVWLDDKSGWWMAEFLVWNADTQAHCESPAYSVSCAYEPTEVVGEGEYHNIPYAEEITNGDYTHLAIVTNPRYEGARIFVNSKGGKMSWRFWEKGARKNASPLDPSKEMVDVGGKQVSLQNLYDALPEDEKPKYNDDTVLETPKGEKTLGELKKNFLEKEKTNAEGEKIKTSAPADAGHAEHDEGKGGFEHSGACSHCQHPAFNAADKEKEGPGEKHPLPDLRHSEDNPSQAEAAAKKLDAEVKEKSTLELQQKADEEKKNAADAEAKAAEEKKNTEDKAAEEKKNADEKDAKEKELAEKRNAGKKSFAALRNAREFNGDSVNIIPVSADDRLAKGAKKYGSA